nr:allatostatin:ISOTYPE=BLAST-4 [Blattella germanica]
APSSAQRLYGFGL